MSTSHHFDCIVIGSGLAGLSVALSLPGSYRTAILSKDVLINTASDKAQGGIAAVWDKLDSFEQHINDTLVAGAGLCDKEAVTHIIENSPDAIKWLLAHSVDFTRDGSGQQLHLTLEGGHSHRRVAHAADKTGHVITHTLQSLLNSHPNIQVFEHYASCELLVENTHTETAECRGVSTLNLSSGEMETFVAPHMVLATGGTGQLFTHTTNPAVATGDGIAMAWRAGCRVANLEFIQFHPTALVTPDGKTFLISEAVRGEGGLLRRPDGSRFMPEYDERAELAPRDIVARAIEAEIKKSAGNHVLLDISHMPKPEIVHHFPMIYDTCLSYGIDISTTPIPVAPAAHYTCGGVLVNQSGQTDIKGLYCAGETAYTGLHGANRLASNSLLECIVSGRDTAASITAQQPWQTPPAYANTVGIKPTPPAGQTDAEPAPTLENVKTLMTHYFGIVRNNLDMQTALAQLNRWKVRLTEKPLSAVASLRDIELRNLLDVASLMLQCGLTRKESRGLHYNTDYPEKAERALPTVLAGKAWY
ncbi:MAG: L-aspartate oxidase [Alcaligenaceae bacterium]|nr:L-aspartate oxidase [Alcaligenaceae bacterium]